VQASGASTATIAGQRRRFNDKFRDDLTGLSYYGVRYYDGLALGWTQADPMYRFVPDAAWAEPRRAGLYQFDLGNPVRYMDPDGRDPGGYLPDLPSVDDLSDAMSDASDYADDVGDALSAAGGYVKTGGQAAGFVALELSGPLGQAVSDELGMGALFSLEQIFVAADAYRQCANRSLERKAKQNDQGRPMEKRGLPGAGKPNALPKGADVVNSNGQKLVQDHRTGKWVKPGGSKKAPNHGVKHPTRKRAVDAARKRGARTPTKGDGPHRKGGRHVHPVDKGGADIHDGVHDDYPM
jgi:RHS repeat-associated protein